MILVRQLTHGSPHPLGKCGFADMLFYYRNVRVKNRTQCRSVPKAVIKCTFGLGETHSYDFSPPAFPWVAPPPGQMYISHIRFCYNNVRATNKTQCWSVPKVVLKFTLGAVETHLGEFYPPANPRVAQPLGQMWFCLYALLI